MNYLTFFHSLWILFDFFLCVSEKEKVPLGTVPILFETSSMNQSGLSLCNFPHRSQYAPCDTVPAISPCKETLIYMVHFYTNHWPIMASALSPGGGGGTFTPINLQFIKFDNLGWGDSNNITQCDLPSSCQPFFLFRLHIIVAKECLTVTLKMCHGSSRQRTNRWFLP